MTLSGAGQKKKPLADKILEGNPGRRKSYGNENECTDAAELEGESMPPPRDYIFAGKTKKCKNNTGGGKMGKNMEVAEGTQVCSPYPGAAYRAICPECGAVVSSARNVSLNLARVRNIRQLEMPSRHLMWQRSQSFMKQANNLWYQIYQVGR